MNIAKERSFPQPNEESLKLIRATREAFEKQLPPHPQAIEIPLPMGPTMWQPVKSRDKGDAG